MFGRGRKTQNAAVETPPGPDLEAVAQLLPERGGWEGFVRRVTMCCGDLAAPSEGTLSEGSIASGLEAARALDRTSLHLRLAPPGGRQREGFEARVRLGLFFAGCLKYLLPLLAVVKVSSESGDWEPLHHSYGDFVAQDGAGEPQVAWPEDQAPHAGRVLMLASLFVRQKEVVEALRPAVAQEVFDYLRPGGHLGLFGTILADAGRDSVQQEPVDVARVFLEGLVEAVQQKVLRVNTRADGHVFVTPEFWLLTSPVGLGEVRDMLRNRKQERRYNFTRREIFGALISDGHLVAADGAEEGNAVRIYEVSGKDWDEPLALYGMAIASESLSVQSNLAAVFEGTVSFKREIKRGRDKE